MPRGDRTGPLGQGPMSGRGAGWCSGAGAPGFASAWGPRGAGMGHGGGMGYSGGMGYGGGRASRGGAGWGRGAGGGRGFRHWFRATGIPGWARWGGAAVVPPLDVPASEQQQLAWQAETLERELETIKARLAEISGPKNQE